MEAYLGSSFSEGRRLSQKTYKLTAFALSCAFWSSLTTTAVFISFASAIGSIWIAFIANLIIMVVGLFFLISGFFLSFTLTLGIYSKQSSYRIYVALCLNHGDRGFLVCYPMLTIPTTSPSSEWGLNFLIYPLAMGQAKYAAGNLWFIVYLWVFFTLYFIVNLLAYPLRKKINLVPILMGICGVFAFSYRYIVWNESEASNLQLFFNMLFTGHYHCYSFLYIGYALRLTYDAFKNKAKWPYTVVALVFTLAFLSFLMVQLYGDDHYHWGSAIAFYGLLAILILCLFNKLPFFKAAPFQWLGSASMWIYMIHENLGYLVIHSFMELDASLYPIGLILVIIFALLAGLLINFTYNKLLSLLPKTSKKTVFL
jgi:peptidoglycan/LPS O-acetylase OafA/YrhL